MGIFLAIITFIDWQTGLGGLISVIITTVTAVFLNYNKEQIEKGLLGFNSLLIGLEIAYFFKFGWQSVLLIIIFSIATLLLTVVLNGLYFNYLSIPPLSTPFVIMSVILYLSTYNYIDLSLKVHEINAFLNNDIWYPLVLYFKSLAIIFFQTNIIAGILISLIILIYSRIFFMLSLAGFFSGIFFYYLMGGSVYGNENIFIGFNFIFTATAIGGIFFVPSVYSYIVAIIATIITAIVASSVKTFVIFYGMPVFAIPFNFTIFVVLIALKYRMTDNNPKFVDFVPGKPEDNFNYFLKNIKRFGSSFIVNNIALPVKGLIKITQSFNGEFTHKENWKYAIDFELLNFERKLFLNDGNKKEDYTIYNSGVYSPVNGTIVAIENNIDDNEIGNMDNYHNFGNYIIIFAWYGVYVKLAHLLKGSITVKVNQTIKSGEFLGKVGNSGRSPYPHLHLQVQEVATVGAYTIPFKFNNYILNKDNFKEIIVQNVPSKDDVIEFTESTESFTENFNLFVNRKFKFKKNNQIEVIKSSVDLYGRLYLQSDLKNSKLYFNKDNFFFYFLDFEGDLTSVLFDFFKIIPKIPLHYENDLKWNENLYYPQKGIKKLINDFIYTFLPVKTVSLNLKFGKKSNVDNLLSYVVYNDDTKIYINKSFIYKIEAKDLIIEQIKEGEK